MRRRGSACDGSPHRGERSNSAALTLYVMNLTPSAACPAREDLIAMAGHGHGRLISVGPLSLPSSITITIAFSPIARAIAGAGTPPYNQRESDVSRCQLYRKASSTPAAGPPRCALATQARPRTARTASASPTSCTPSYTRGASRSSLARPAGSERRQRSSWPSACADLFSLRSVLTLDV